MHGQRRGRLRQAAAEQLRLSRGRQPQRAAARQGAAAPAQSALDLQLHDGAGPRVGAGIARLTAAQRRRRPLHVRVVHGEVLLDDAVHGHGRLREVRQVARRHVALDVVRRVQRRARERRAPQPGVLQHALGA